MSKKKQEILENGSFLIQGKDFGDVADRREIRKRLNCHSFKWYLDNVFPEKFILDENVHAFGEVDFYWTIVILYEYVFYKVRNPSTKFCLDTLGKDEKSSIPISIYSCQNGVSANQYFSLTKDDRLRREDVCSISSDSSTVTLTNCNYGDRNQKWTHEKVETENIFDFC